MAKNTITILQDDIDGSDAAETIRYALDGTTYEIELSEANAAALREGLGQYINVSRVVVPQSKAPVRQTSQSYAGLGKKLVKKVRAWAPENGWEVNQYGRIPGDVVDAYFAANPQDRP
jgi:Lsr2